MQIIAHFCVFNSIISCRTQDYLYWIPALIIQKCACKTKMQMECINNKKKKKNVLKINALIVHESLNAFLFNILLQKFWFVFLLKKIRENFINKQSKIKIKKPQTHISYDLKCKMEKKYAAIKVIKPINIKHSNFNRI